MFYCIIYIRFFESDAFKNNIPPDDMVLNTNIFSNFTV